MVGGKIDDSLHSREEVYGNLGLETGGHVEAGAFCGHGMALSVTT
jgi:hypothetical protein